ncbi:succinate dehydrogenase assembly factor [Wolffia australiana]
MATMRGALQRLRQSGLMGAPMFLRSRRSNFNPGVSFFSTEPESDVVDLSNEESKRRVFNRLLYRSRQRGFLELDLVLGNWVEENIRSMDELRIKALIEVLNLENPDLWKWLTGQEQPPDLVNTNPVFHAVQTKVMKNLDRHASAATRAAPGQPWVRGWDDKRGLDGPKYGNQ